MRNILNAHILEVFQTFTPTFKKLFIQNCPKEFIRFLCECIVNIIHGKLLIPKSKLQQYRRQLRKLSQKTPSYRERRTVLCSKKGLSLIKVISAAIIDRFKPEEDGRI